MNIVHICVLAPYTEGFNYQDNLLPQYHQKMGHDVSVITSRWMWGDNGKLQIDPRSGFSDRKVRVIRLPMHGREHFGKKFIKLKGFYQVLDNLRPDIIFIHGLSFCNIADIAEYLKTHQHVKAFADNHSDYTNSATNWLSKHILHKIIWKSYVQKLLGRVEKFYGVLPARVSFMTEMYGIPESMCDLLLMGADDNLAREAEDINVKKTVRERYGIAGDDKLIVTGGKFDIWKKQVLLLMEAVRSLDNPKCKLLVFGSVDKTFWDEFNALVDGVSVQFIGWVEPKLTYTIFSAADLVVFPGRHSVFWEQVVAQGIPMVVKKWPETQHIDIGGNVVYIEKDSEEEIENILQTLLENQGQRLDKMKAEAGKKEKDQFLYSQISEYSIQSIRGESAGGAK